MHLETANYLYVDPKKKISLNLNKISHIALTKHILKLKKKKHLHTPNKSTKIIYLKQNVVVYNLVASILYLVNLM